MANALYDYAREGFLAGDLDWDGHTIQIDLLDAANHTPNTSTHQFRSSVASNARVTNFGGSVQTLANKTVASGVADADDVVFSSLSSAPSFEYVQCFRNAGSDATNRLIFIIDTATGLPTPASVSSITVTWDNGTNKIFRI